MLLLQTIDRNALEQVLLFKSKDHITSATFKAILRDFFRNERPSLVSHNSMEKV